MGGCATQIPTPAIDSGVKSFRKISYSRRDTCETQKEIAEHNAVWERLATGKTVAYEVVCPAAPPQPAAKVATKG